MVVGTPLPFIHRFQFKEIDMPVLNFTPAFMASGLVTKPADKRTEYCDSEVRGLLIEVRSAPDSIPTWYLRYKANGKTAYTRLGNVQELTLAQARKQAIVLKAKHTLAPKQAATDKAPMGSMTLDTFMRDHYFPHAAQHKRSVKRDDQLHRLRIGPKFGHLALSAINRRDVQAFQNSLLKEGLSPASADHHVKLMRRVLNLAVQWEMLEKNPLKGIELYLVDNQVENYLDAEQLDRLVEVLRTDKNRMVCLILMFLISTGSRLTESLTATWKNVSVEGGVWRVDASLSKSKKSRSIPLNDSALWVLEQLTSKGKSDYLFPSPVTGKPYTTISRAFWRILKVANVPRIRIHDLRHGFASLLVSGGRSLYEVQQILGHSDPKVTMRYAHLSARALQDAANAASVIVRKPVAAEPEAKAA
jgi:site-specific recombinase XerD